MGNKLMRRHPPVDERYTRPQGLYQHRNLDYRKLRRSILNSQLAPCFPGVEDATVELDECPICFLFYPSLNRSKCCLKGLCTECYLQIRASYPVRCAQCPFCKTSNYAVDYRGFKTIEEKGVEQAEEQKVIEAKIRIRQQEILDEEQRMLKREEDLREGRQTEGAELFQQEFANLHSFALPSRDPARVSTEARDGASEDSTSLDENNPLVVDGSLDIQARSTTELHNTRMQTLVSRSHREDDFDIDLEEIMLMEAIWLSIQEQAQMRQGITVGLSHGNLGMVESSGVSNQNQAVDSASQVQILGETSCRTGTNSMSSGLARAIAALAERQVQTVVGQPANSLLSENMEVRNGASIEDSVGTSLNAGPQMPSYFNAIGERAQEAMRSQDQGQVGEFNGWTEVSLQNDRAISPLARRGSRVSICDSVVDQSSEVVEVGTSFSSSIPSTSELPWEAPELASHCMECPAELGVVASPAPMLPDSFEEQMMLAMALSLAEAQARLARY